jgi:hypothetical protein
MDIWRQVRQMATRKTIYIDDENVLDYFEKQGNKSKYVENLIKNDMNGIKKHWSKQDIIDIIEEYLQNYQIEVKEKIINENNEEKETLKQLTQNLLNL